MLSETGENLGVMPIAKALELRKPGLDVIEISASAKPPVVRLMSFDKYRYDEEKKAKKERQAQRASALKQVQISAKAAENDLRVKIRKLEEFLAEGHPVEIQMRLRGREKGNKAWAEEKMQAFLKMIVGAHKIVSPPKFAGRGMLAQITPEK